MPHDKMVFKENVRKLKAEISETLLGMIRGYCAQGSPSEHPHPLAALKSDSSDSHVVYCELTSDGMFMNRAASIDPHALQYASAELRGDKAWILPIARDLNCSDRTPAGKTEAIETLLGHSTLDDADKQDIRHRMRTPLTTVKSQQKLPVLERVLPDVKQPLFLRN